MSREAIALNAVGGSIALTLLGVPFPAWTLSLMVIVAVFAQVMVYADTGRDYWNADRAIPRFFGSVVVFGCALAWLRSRTDSVYPGMVVHGLFNGVALIVAVAVG